MKKVLLGMMAATALLFTSCSQDEFNPGANGANATLTVNLSTPQLVSRAFSDGKTATQLQYAVYDITDGTPQIISDFTETEDEINIRTTKNFQLANGRTYNLVFWAANAEAPYTVDFGDSEATMTVDYDNTFANAETLDAFFACKEVTVSGSATVDVKMYRPFAQINVGTDDYVPAAVAGAIPSVSSFTIDNVYTTLDLMSGDVVGATTRIFKDGAIPAKYDETANTGEKFPVDGYDYLAMTYALVDAEQALTTVKFSYTGGTVTEEITVGGVPVQRNYRTNLYGSILTSGIVANVEIIPGFNEPDNDIDLDKTALVEFDQENGKFVCTKPALPVGVTKEQLEGKGAVAIIDGEPVVIENDYTKIAAAMLQTSEIYFAPNAEITTGSHLLVVPNTGLTVYGNGATISGNSERDFRLHVTNAKNEEINLTIYDLNNVKIWGGDAEGCTFNVTLKNCTTVGSGITDGSHSLFMTRSGDKVDNTAHYVLENCYAKDIQVGVHFTYGGTLVAKSCTFDNVGIPFNIAKKGTGTATLDISISNCTFNKCGIPENTAAWNYSAPIRIVDNVGPHKSTHLKVDKCTFNETQSLDPSKEGKCDILLVEYRTDDMTRRWYDVTYDITNCGDYKLVDTCETMRGDD